MLHRAMAMLLALVPAAAASAHFVFIVPDDAASGKAKVIFSDTLKPDDRVNIERIADTKLFALAMEGKDSELKWALDKTGAHYKLEAPGSGTRVVYAITDFGVLQRGDSKPFHLHYYSKAVFGPIPATEKCTLGKRVPLEIVPVTEGGKVRFQALVGGKPQAKAEISVMLPDAEKSEDLVADENGLTPAYDKGGQYGVRIRHTESKSGEDKGKKYEEVRHYATLVLHFEKASK